LPRITIVFGALLIVLGLVAYFVMQEPGARSVTALIPAFIGLPLLVHAAAALGLLGLLGTIGGFIKALQWMGGTVPERPAAVRVQAIMAVMSVIFIVLCVRSFITARKARQAGFPLD
jgi:hypothetical protein